MNLKRSLGVLALGVLLIGSVLAQTVTCPIDKLSMMFTGTTKVEMGKMLYEHRCANGHTTWVVK